MIAQSQSGTGKTAAFVLTMLSRADQNENCPQVNHTKICRHIFEGFLFSSFFSQI